MKSILVIVVTCLYFFPSRSIAHDRSRDSRNTYSNIGSYSSTEGENSETANEDEGVVVAINDQIISDDLSPVEVSGEVGDQGELNCEQPMSLLPLTYIGQLKLDDDGSGYYHLDPDHQSQTWWEPNGKCLNADVDSYVVVPNWLQLQGVKKGDAADVKVDFIYTMGDGNSYRYTASINSRVGDLGPDAKGVGEISIAAAQQLGFGVKDVWGRGPIPTFLGLDWDINVMITYYPSGS